MKNNLFFILIFCGLIFSKNYSYYLSKANNAFDQDDLDQAIFYYNEALNINKFGADAYLQLGYIHNSRKLSKTALQYFKLAEKNKSYFLYPERSVELYLNMAAAYNRLEQKNTEKIYLEKDCSRNSREKN